MFDKNIWIFEKGLLHVPYSLIQDKNPLTIVGIAGVIFGMSVVLSSCVWIVWGCYVS